MHVSEWKLQRFHHVYLCFSLSNMHLFVRMSSSNIYYHLSHRPKCHLKLLDLTVYFIAPWQLYGTDVHTHGLKLTTRSLSQCLLDILAVIFVVCPEINCFFGNFDVHMH